MNKTFKLYAAIFIVVMLILAFFEVNKTEVTNWTKNFSVKEKTPFGLFVFNQEAEHLFAGKLEKTQENPYSYYSNHKKKPHNILVIETKVDQTSWKKILEQVSNGSDAMIITSRFPRKIADSIGIDVSYYGDVEKSVLKLTDAKLQNTFMEMDKFPSSGSINYIKSGSDILGKNVTGNKTEAVNFIKTKFGKGNIFIHTEPLFVTNYYLLKPGNFKYAEAVFGFLDNKDTVWFVDSTKAVSTSPLRFILQHPALKYAWWMFLGGMLLFIIFNAKRKQRIVPIIEPLKNTSVEFVKSIGNLYLQEGDFHDMMAKKAQYFLYKVRLDFLIDTQNLDDDFAKKLQLKTGKPIEGINEIISLIKKAQDPYASVMREDLVRMNKLIDDITRFM